MKFAADFRAMARDALRGKWGIAVAAGLIAMLLGGVSSGGPEIKVNIVNSNVNFQLGYAGQPLFSTGGDAQPGIIALLMGSIFYLILAFLVLVIVFFILGSVVEVGYDRLNLDLMDGQSPALSQLFSYFPYWKTMLAARFLRSLLVFLWSLLLVIPGIVASFSYAMTGYLLAEFPDMTASEAISRSKELMAGNRWRLFCLRFSFIGWDILCLFTLGIGNLWLLPYRNAAEAAFYREISGTVSAPCENETW